MIQSVRTNDDFLLKNDGIGTQVGTYALLYMGIFACVQVLQRGGRYPPALAERLKTKKLLQWVVTHPTNIASANFLSGAHKVKTFISFINDVNFLIPLSSLIARSTISLPPHILMFINLRLHS